MASLKAFICHFFLKMLFHIELNLLYTYYPSYTWLHREMSRNMLNVAEKMPQKIVDFSNNTSAYC